MREDFLAEQIRARNDVPISLQEPVEVSSLPTPALVLEYAPFEANLARMAAHVEDNGKGFRPHAKTHKCPEISRRQLDAGAVGICVAKVSEALAQVCAGIEDVLITSPVTSPGKAGLLAELCLLTDGLKIVVDSRQGVEVLKAQLVPEAKLGILVDLDVNMGRTGSREDSEVLNLIESVQGDPRFIFRGFQFYAGHVMHINGHADRTEASLKLWETIVERIEGYAATGIDFDIVTGCGTGTYDIDVGVDAITDLQVGSFIFMDEEYRQIGGVSSERFEDFQVSLSLATTTISQPMQGAITVDAGYKAMASDTVPAAVDELVNTKFRFAGDEHGVLLSRESMQSVALGDVVRLVTPHCDPTVNLHDFYWVLEEDGLIHSLWPITGRGCSW